MKGRQWIVKVFYAALMILIINVTMFNEQPCESALAAETYDESAKLQLVETKLVNQNSEVVRLRGLATPSTSYIYPGWYGGGWNEWYNNDSLNTVKSWGVNFIRLGAKPEQIIQDKSIIDELQRYVDLCSGKELYTAISWQYGDNPNDLLDEAVEFFEVVSKTNAKNPYVIYEICNEPFNTTWDDIVKYANRIIPIIRKNSPDAIILVGTPYKNIGNIKDSMLTVVDRPLQYSNIMYTTHCYTGQSLSTELFNEIKTLLQNNLAVFISEWGTTKSNGTDGFFKNESDVFVEFMDQNGICWANFNFSDIQYKLKDNIPYDSSMVKHGKWNNKFEDNDLSKSGLYIKNLFINGSKDSVYLLSINNSTVKNSKKAVSESTCMLMNRLDGYAFWDTNISSKIDKVVFCSSNTKISNVIKQWDVSMLEGSSDVTAYLTQSSGTDLYTLTIKARSGSVVAPKKINNFFKKFTALTEVDFTWLDTSSTTEVRALFCGCKKLRDVNIDILDFSKVEDVSCMFEQCESIEEIVFADNMRSVKGFPYTFSSTKSLKKLVLGDFDIEKMGSTKSMFTQTNKNLEVYMNGADEMSFIKSIAQTVSASISVTY